MLDLFGNPTDPRQPDSLSAIDRAIIHAYASVARSLDDLPYTEQFEELYTITQHQLATHPEIPDRRAVFHRLLTLRKAAKLEKYGRAHSATPAINGDEEFFLTNLIIQSCTTLGQRDQLPYTPAFDTLRDRFIARTGRDISPHDLWRIIAKLAK